MRQAFHLPSSTGATLAILEWRPCISQPKHSFARKVRWLSCQTDRPSITITDLLEPLWNGLSRSLSVSQEFSILSKCVSFTALGVAFADQWVRYGSARMKLRLKGGFPASKRPMCRGKPNKMYACRQGTCMWNAWSILRRFKARRISAKLPSETKMASISFCFLRAGLRRLPLRDGSDVRY